MQKWNNQPIKIPTRFSSSSCHWTALWQMNSTVEWMWEQVKTWLGPEPELPKELQNKTIKRKPFVHVQCSSETFEMLWYQSVNAFTNSISQRDHCICAHWMHLLLSWFSLICCFLFFAWNKATLLLHNILWRCDSSVDLDVRRNQCSQW